MNSHSKEEILRVVQNLLTLVKDYDNLLQTNDMQSDEVAKGIAMANNLIGSLKEPGKKVNKGALTQAERVANRQSMIRRRLGFN